MKREDAARIVTDLAKPVYSFAARRCAGYADAEDLSQEILFRAFRALLSKDGLDDPEKYVWRIARNALANYYRGKSRHGIGVPLEEIAEIAAEPDEMPSETENGEILDIVPLLSGALLCQKSSASQIFDD